MINMQEIWPTGETRNQFILFIGGLFGLLYLIALFVGYAQRRCQPVVVGLSNPDESEHVYEYILTVRTSLLPYSGCSPTTSVFIQLHGEFQNSSFFLLKKYSVTQDILSRGALDIFVLYTTDYLGDIHSVGVQMVDEISDKSVWKPAQFELHYPSKQTRWTSARIPKLVCQSELETHVFLSKRTNMIRKWSTQFFIYLLSYHQWLSMTLGTTRFGIFTTFLNLQLFFCCLALILATNLISLLIVEDNNSEFDISTEKFIGCVIVTLTVGGVSWIVETLARNAKPCSKITKAFRFKGLHELKKHNLAKERIYKEIDSDVKETNDLNPGHSVQNVNNHANMKQVNNNDIGTGHENMKSEQCGVRYIYENDKRYNAKTRRDEYNHSKQNIFSCCYSQQESISEKDMKKHPVCDNLNASFTDPLELSDFYGESFMTFIRTFSSKTLDNGKGVGHFQTLQHSVSRDLLRMLTEHKHLLYFKLVVSGAPTDWFREFDYKAMCEDEILSLNPPEAFYKHPLEDIDLPKNIGRQETHIGDGDFVDKLEVVNLNQEIHHVKERCRTSDAEIMGGHSTYVPMYLFCQKDYRLFDYCLCMGEHCRKCTQLVSKVEGLSFLILRNSFVMIMDTSVKTSFSQQDSILKMLTDMLYISVNSGMALIMEESVRMEVDEDTLILDSAAAMIVHEALNDLYKKQCKREEIEHIQTVSKLFVTDLVQTAVDELRVDYSLQKQIKDMCEHAIQAASDEVWNEFHDPVHVFGELVLKEFLVSESSENGIEDEDGESKDKDPVFEMLHQAVSPWQRKLNDLPSSAKDLLIQCLIDRFETSVFKMSDLYENITECGYIEMKVDQVCTEAADSFINPLLIQIQTEFSGSGWKSIASLTCHMEIYIGYHLREYVEKVKEESHTLLYEQFLDLMSRSLVKMAIVKAKLVWTEELELKTNNETDTEPSLKQEEITELRKGLLPVRNYLELISRIEKKIKKKELTQHVKSMSKNQKEYVSINLQNAVDLYSAVDDLPRDYTDEELYVVEWFVTGNLYKVLPTGIKTVLNLFMFSATLLAMGYFVLKGAEISTAKTQEWACLVLISCALFGFVLEPLKVFIMMLLERKMD